MKTMRATLLTIIALILGSVSLSAQVTNELDKGDDAFYNLDYDDALYYYQMANEIQPNDPNITRRIAKLYRRIGMPDTAAVYYKKAIDMGSTEPEDILFYAESLKSLRQYDEAVKWYKVYSEKVPNDSRAISHIRDTDYFLELFADSAKYSIKHLKINNSDPVIGVTMVSKNTYLISAVNLMTNSNADKNEVSAYLDNMK
ncbi:MAG: tetratricopeptide repeat protein [Flavobacteriales bacterium]